jgi:membrane protein
MEKKTNETTQKRKGGSWLVFKRCLARYNEDNVVMLSNGMVYASLIALVPCLAFIYSFISQLGFTEPVVRLVNQFLVETFGEDNGKLLIDYLDKFLNNAMGLGIISMLSFFVTFLLLIDNLHVTVNRLFHCKNKSNIAVRIGKYAAALIGAMIAIALMVIIYTKFIASLFSFAGGTSISWVDDLIESIISKALVLLSLFVITYVMPDCKVSTYAAVNGAMFGSVLVSLLEYVFKLIVKFSVSKFVIYGSLASLLFFFMFLSWTWRIIFTAVVLTKVLDEQKKGEV